MHPVIIPWRQIHSGKAAVNKFAGQITVAANQFVEGEILSFGLHHVRATDTSQLADGAVCGRNNRRGVFANRSGTIFQSAGKKCIEAGELIRILNLRLLEINLELFEEQVDEGSLDPWCFAAGQCAHDA